MQLNAYRLNYVYESCHWWFLARREIILQILHNLKNNFTKSSPKILDYGCGTGGLTQTLYQFGEVEGVDFDDEALAYCKKRGLKNIRKINSAEDIQTKSFNLITSFDVLEHIEDDQTQLNEWLRMLDDDGYLLITVPAYQWMWSGEDVVSKHKRRYTRGELIQKTQNAGFQIVRCTYFNTVLFPLISTQRLLNRFFNPKSMEQSDVKRTNPFVNMILCKTFALEKHFLRAMNFPFGVSIMLIARKIN